MKGSFVEEDVADEGRVDVLPGRNTDRGGDKQRDPRARRRRVLTIEDSVEPLNDTDELPEASAPRREAEIPADKGEKEWTEVKALSAELDVLSPLSQLAKQSSATKPAAPSFDHKTRNKASIGRVASDESLQQSWDSLTYFSKKNRSRLSQAGAAVVGGNFTVTSASHDPPKPIVEAMIRDEAATSVMASGSQQAVQQAGGPDVKQQQQQQQQHPPSENIFETTSTTLLTASQFENFANSIEDTAHTSFSLDEPPRTGPGLLTRDQQQQQQLDEPKEDREFEREETMVEIPTLPRGRVLKLELLSTWGDPYYVGLHGIEVFDENGEQLKVVTIAATPPSINVLPEYDSDPRTADKLIDGISFTCDELHAWLAPFEDEQEHSITLELAAEIAKPAPAISMLRIWNYNKSRAHSYRGVRRMRASLDDTPVFEGEIRKALGSLEGAASACEMILFTASEDILRNIEKNDVALRPDEDANLLREAQQLLRARPKTADKLQRVALDDLPVSYGDMLAEEGLVRDVARPRTSVPTSVCEEEEEEEEGKEQYPRARVVVAFSSKKSNAEHLAAAAAAAASPDQLGESASNGGGGGAAAGTSSIIAQARGTTTTNRHYVGLSGIQVYADASGAAISILPSQLSAEPRDLETMGFSGDPRTLSKLVDGATETVDDRHFWLVPFDAKSPPWLALDLGAPTTVWGIGVSNYNKSPEDAARGARVIQVEADGELRGLVELRPAPGRGWVDFHQRIALDDIEMPRPPIKQFGVRHVSAVQKPRADHILEDYETPELPRGAMVRLVFHGTWGDAYYLGLDGLELRDAEQRVVSPERVCGLPDSIRVLGDDFRRDLRVPANLFSSSSSRVWLAPNRISLSDAEFPGLPDENELYVFLNKPVSLAALTIWNYSKTPNRGARELSVYLDNNLVARVRLARGDAAPDGQHVLFTTDRFNRRGSNRAAAVAEGGQDVLCIDENQVRIRSRTMFDTDVCAEGVFSAQMHHNHRPTTGIASTTGDLVGSRRR
ncbi:hypothetical protein CTAYLR_009437 [Chrysophaeum taylorii]|uniref:KATNIP domain-containing protein n=1 Tax=Chrysophaeum taylorii TaxID=2483200 RepID=A0AAD7XMU4_9STRA|nr:hypothetical protein CTAYLR_009437 [Chrysophaeum taylorii]